MDTANNQTRASAERARRLLEAYGGQLAALRLLVRGISAEVIHPVDVRTLDVATPAGRSLLILGMMTYFSFMSMLVGGFYLAIDTTAGERERGSLEPLLALPVRRAELIVGKMLATSAFMSISLLLTLAAFGVVLQFIPLEALGMSANFGPRVVLAIFAVMLPFVPLGAGLMTAVASFTRSNREAQSWLSVVMLLPIVPIMFAVVNGTKPTAALMTIPSLSQHLLATSLMRGDAIPPLHVADLGGHDAGAGCAAGVDRDPAVSERSDIGIGVGLSRPISSLSVGLQPDFRDTSPPAARHSSADSCGTGCSRRCGSCLVPSAARRSSASESPGPAACPRRIAHRRAPGSRTGLASMNSCGTPFTSASVPSNVPG